MKKIAALCLLTLLSYGYAHAWGQTGHRATGWIAEKYLSKKAKREMDRILAGQSLAIASTWMDEIRSDSTYNYTADWHWVTIQDGQTYEQSVKNPNGDVIQTIERIITELKSKKFTGKEEAERSRRGERQGEGLHCYGQWSGDQGQAYERVRTFRKAILRNPRALQ